MSMAAQINREHTTPKRVRRAAQAQCSHMTRDHRADKDRYYFADHSIITVVRNTVRIEGGAAPATYIHGATK
jgi:hypothetical protein